MRKLILVLACAAVIAVAADASAHGLDEIYQTLGVNAPRLLPDHALYAFKEFGRGIRRFFTFDRVKKAELELSIADEKLAEFETIAAKRPDDSSAVTHALTNYLEAHERLQEQLASLKDKNKNVDRLLEKLADRVFEHETLFNDLASELKEKEAVQDLLRASGEIARTAKEALALDKNKFEEKLKEKIKAETDNFRRREPLAAFDNLYGELEEELEDLGEELKDEFEEAKAEDAQRCGPKPLAPVQANCIGPLCKDGTWEYICPDNATKPPVPNPPSTGPGQEPPLVVCTQEFDPVCGINGKTYSNECVAEVAGVKIRHRGACAESSKTLPPVSKPSAPPPSPLPPPPPAAAQTLEFKIETDDLGFYPSVITVPKGTKVKITFVARTTNVYFAGMEFRSRKFTSSVVKAGQSTTVEFAADDDMAISSYWPATGVLKSTMRVEIN